MSAESRTRAGVRTKAMLEQMHLNELRRARELSQQALAKRLGTTQPEVSRIESRADMYLSTLRRFIEAMGGELVIVAQFPDSAVRINQFAELGKAS
ncbi:MAG: XRE family transcriptional regulator [Gemmatimonadaceae bacterium]